MQISIWAPTCSGVRTYMVSFKEVANFGCVLTGFVCSCSIEIVQHITQTGYLQLDDVVTNTTGTLLGWLGKQESV